MLIPITLFIFVVISLLFGVTFLEKTTYQKSHANSSTYACLSSFISAGVLFFLTVLLTLE